MLAYCVALPSMCMADFLLLLRFTLNDGWRCGAALMQFHHDCCTVRGGMGSAELEMAATGADAVAGPADAVRWGRWGGACPEC